MYEGFLVKVLYYLVLQYQVKYVFFSLEDLYQSGLQKLYHDN